MPKKKTIIFDLDGTAIDSPGQKVPTKRLINACREVEKTYNLCAATGRVWSFAKPVFQGLSLVDPCIISGGTQICDPRTGNILWQSDIEPADLDSVIGIMKQYPDFKILFNDYAEADYFHGGTAPKDLRISEAVYFFEQIFVPKKVAPEIKSQLSKINGITCTLAVAQRAGFIDLHITHREATKEHAVAQLLSILQADKHNTIGIGDGLNDIHLFRAVSKKVAMGNAVSQVKKAADTVIGSVKDDGMAAFLENIDKFEL